MGCLEQGRVSGDPYCLQLPPPAYAEPHLPSFLRFSPAPARPSFPPAPLLPSLPPAPHLGCCVSFPSTAHPRFIHLLAARIPNPVAPSTRPDPPAPWNISFHARALGTSSLQSCSRCRGTTTIPRVMDVFPYWCWPQNHPTSITMSPSISRAAGSMLPRAMVSPRRIRTWSVRHSVLERRGRAVRGVPTFHPGGWSQWGVFTSLQGRGEWIKK